MIKCTVIEIQYKKKFPADASLIFHPCLLGKLVGMINGRTNNVAKLWVPAWPNG